MRRAREHWRNASVCDVCVAVNAVELCLWIAAANILSALNLHDAFLDQRVVLICEPSGVPPPSHPLKVLRGAVGGTHFTQRKKRCASQNQSLPWGDRMVAMLRLAGALLIVTFTWPACAQAEDVQAIAQAVDEHYNHVRTLQAEFTEVYRGSGMERTESGTVWLAKGGLKKPGKMRWEYRSPKEKLFVSDGKDAWFYLPDERQARKSAARKLDDIRSPLAFLLGKTKLQKELQGLSLAPDVAPLAAGNLVLRGVPEAMADRVSEILLEVTPAHQIVRIVIAEVDGSTTEYRFGDQREDVAIPDARFQFHPPPGTETVEGELGG
jgi:outer membrane lipoprotein carrier protein